jgi:archaellum component FlaF (FlaF/FlaG flagellin family)
MGLIIDFKGRLMLMINNNLKPWDIITLFDNHNNMIKEEKALKKLNRVNDLKAKFENEMNNPSSSIHVVLDFINNGSDVMRSSDVMNNQELLNHAVFNNHDNLVSVGKTISFMLSALDAGGVIVRKNGFIYKL